MPGVLCCYGSRPRGCSMRLVPRYPCVTDEETGSGRSAWPRPLHGGPARAAPQTFPRRPQFPPLFSSVGACAYVGQCAAGRCDTSYSRASARSRRMRSSHLFPCLVTKAVHDNGTYISPGLGGTVAQSTLQAADPRGTCESHAFIGLRQTS